MKQNVKPNKVHDEQILKWQSYDKKCLSDKNQVPLYMKRMISL